MFRDIFFTIANALFITKLINKNGFAKILDTTFVNIGKNTYEIKSILHQS